MIFFLLLLAIIQEPDRRGEVVTDRPAYHDATAAAPIPPELHVKNEGGSNGAGLCVISSILANGRYQRVPTLEGGKDSELWRTAKRRPGGYYPEKLAALVEQTVPGEKYASYEGADPTVLESLSSQGYPIGATMSTGALYGYQRIHHMISLIHYRTGQWACVVDNNDPGKYHWMPAPEFARRWIDGDNGWAWIWTRPPKSAVMGGGLAAFVLLTLLAWRRLRLALMPPAVLASLAAVVLVGPLPVDAAQVDPLAGYERWTDPTGRPFLRATVESPTYGRTTIYARPNSWVDPEPKPEPKASTFDGMIAAGGTMDFGVDLSKSKAASGTLITNDPLFQPGSVGLSVTRDGPTGAAAGKPESELVLIETLGAPAAIVAAAIAFIAWIRRRHP